MMMTLRVGGRLWSSPRPLAGIAAIAVAATLLTDCQSSLSAKAGQAADDKAARQKSATNLKRIGRAMLDYHDSNAWLPPAAFYGVGTKVTKDSKPLLSWRVLILPYLGEEKLYRQFKLDELWDGEHNKKLLAKMPKVYAPVRGTSKVPHSTYYQVFTGKRAAFEALPRPGGLRGQVLPMFWDGAANTFLVVEGGQAVPWSKPEDLHYDAEKPLPRLGGLFGDGFHAVFADGAVRFIKNKTDEKTIRALITRNGGEDVDLSKLP